MNSVDIEQASSGYYSPARNSVMETEKPGIKVASQDLTLQGPMPTEEELDETPELSQS